MPQVEITIILDVPEGTAGSVVTSQDDDVPTVPPPRAAPLPPTRVVTLTSPRPLPGSSDTHPGSGRCCASTSRG